MADKRRLKIVASNDVTGASPDTPWYCHQCCRRQPVEIAAGGRYAWPVCKHEVLPEDPAVCPRAADGSHLPVRDASAATGWSCGRCALAMAGQDQADYLILGGKR